MDKATFLFKAMIALAIAYMPPVFVSAETFTTGNIFNAEILLNNADPGDTVRLKAGTYSDFEITIRQRGVKFQPVTSGKVTFRRKAIIKVVADDVNISGFRFYRAWWLNSITTNISLFGVSGCTIRDVAFIECGKNNPSGRYHPCIYLGQGSSLNLIANCMFRNLYEAGVHFQNRVGDSANLYNTIGHCMFVGNLGGEHNGMESIRTGHGDTSSSVNTYTNIYNCLFEDVQGDGETVSIKSSRALVKDCTFRNCPNKGQLSIRDGSNSVVEGNWFLNMRIGIRVFGKNHWIRNNFLKNCRVGIMVPGGNGTANYTVSENCKIAYNTVVNPTKAAFEFGWVVSPRSIVFKSNIAKSNVPGSSLSFVHPSNTVSASQISANRNYFWATNGAVISSPFGQVIEKDPKLVAYPGSWIQKLSSTSPCRNKGGGVSLPDFDIDGEPRTSQQGGDSLPDVGADEYSSSEGFNLPLHYSDLGGLIGPYWMGN